MLRLLKQIISWLLIDLNLLIRIDQKTERILNTMATQKDIDALTAQLTKASEEIVAEVEKLQEQNPELDLTGLRTIAQKLDDRTPDNTGETGETDI